MPEVTQQDVARLFVKLEAGEIFFGLMKRLDQAFTPTFVLDQQRTFPEQVDVTVFAVELLDARFKRRNLTALDAKHLEKFIPKLLALASSLSTCRHSLENMRARLAISFQSRGID